jgi:hypothetical protein
MPARDVNLAAAGHLTRHRSTAFSARPLVGTGLKIILTEIGGVDPLVGRGLKSILTEIGGGRPTPLGTWSGSQRGAMNLASWVMSCAISERSS